MFSVIVESDISNRNSTKSVNRKKKQQGNESLLKEKEAKVFGKENAQKISEDDALKVSLSCEEVWRAVYNLLGK